MAQQEEKEWFVVYTRPRAEKKIRDALKKLAIECYLPLLRTRKKWSDRFKWVEDPVFASYIFVHIGSKQQATDVLKIPHSVNFVTSRGKPVPISNTDISLLKIAVSEFAESLTIRNTATLVRGETVRIQEGPFAGKEAVIERIQGKSMVVVAFPALNRSVQVEIPVVQLVKASTSSDSRPSFS